MTAARVMTLAVLTGALLLFGMEPMVGRMLVPYFGSAVSTWLTALMFFQVVLFGGYLYAHLVAPRIGRWHLLLLLLPLVNLPIGVTGEVAPEAPMAHIVLALTLSIGLPFFVLSTTAVVVQLWWSRSEIGKTREAYPLYAASNTGSLLALLGYPFLVEPLSGLNAQSVVWTVGYLAYCGLVVGAWYVARPDLETPRESEQQKAASLGELTLWAALAALPSGFLLAVTGVIASEVGSFPMVWVIPLAIYLGTFVLVFRDRPIGMGLRRFWPEITALGLLGFSLSGGTTLLVLFFHLLLFFLYCMALHAELYDRRPDPAHLTSYYLAISFGGGLGGIVVNLVPPVAFDRYYEYPLLVVGFALIFVALRGSRLKQELGEASLPVAATRLVLFQGFLGLAVFGQIERAKSPPVDTYRNFYGIFRVLEANGVRSLVHGSTLHGAQHLDPAKRDVLLSYYEEGACQHDIYDEVEGERRIAVIGLGAGAVAGMVREGDTLDFFEIDPDNEAMARKWFTFLDESPADPRVLVGDGRLKLMAEGGEPYDVIHLDAFSGDGIPTHLITFEAVQAYLSMLEPDGVLLFHISNRYYDLRPVVKRLADEAGMEVIFSAPGQPAICALISGESAHVSAVEARGWVREPPGLANSELWTDDYVNILGPLVWGAGESFALQKPNKPKR